MDPQQHVLELVFGRWRSQIAHAGVKLDVFECAGRTPKPAAEIADALSIDYALGYRLLRALASQDGVNPPCPQAAPPPPPTALIDFPLAPPTIN